MTRRELLRERADILWRLAESSEVQAVRREMQHLAAVCEDQISELLRAQEQQPLNRTSQRHAL